MNEIWLLAWVAFFGAIYFAAKSNLSVSVICLLISVLLLLLV